MTRLTSMPRSAYFVLRGLAPSHFTIASHLRKMPQIIDVTPKKRCSIAAVEGFLELIAKRNKILFRGNHMSVANHLGRSDWIGESTFT